jgi:CheY-like chemotaxis protein
VGTVLVLCDDGLLRGVLRERLRECGHRVVEAATASEALDQLPGVDVLLLNPHGRGSHALSLFRAAGARHLPRSIVFTTKPHDDVSGRSAVDLIASVEKDLHIEDILRLVERAIEDAGAA